MNITSTIHAAASTQPRYRPFPFYWLIGLLLSFCHERPLLILTSMDRVNPRAFDVMVVIGVLFVLPTLPKRVQLPQQFFIWTKIVWVYVFCAVVYSAFLLPGQYASFSLFYAAKYLEGLVAIYIALKIPLNERRRQLIMWGVACGGMYVAIYCIFQYLGGRHGDTIEIAQGKVVKYFNQVLTGPLGNNYFYLAQLTPLCAIVTLSLVDVFKGSFQRWAVFGLSAFIAWPVLFAGSRTGLGLLVISFVLSIILLRGVKARVFVAAVGAGFAATVLGMSLNHGFLENSSTMTRILGSEGSHNSTEDRLMVAANFDLDKYKWGAMLPLIGGGFYVAPVLEGRTEDYRVGFGVHNTYLFPFEQGGLAAGVLFLVFLGSCILGLRRVVKHAQGPSRALAVALLAYMLASLPAYLAGQIFWMGFDTVHCNVYIVLILLLTLKAQSDSATRLRASWRSIGRESTGRNGC